MDAVPVIEIAAPDREVIRDHRGTILGRFERQSLTGKLIARNARGVLVGIYDPRTGETRDARGRVVGTGNLLGALLMQAR